MMGPMTEAVIGVERFVGETIAGRYQIERLLGEGGMGAVFKARHEGLKRDVAVKLMHSEIGRDPQVSARFDREAQSASRLDHPHCVRVTDFGTWQPPDGSPPAKFMVMQYLQGHELGDLLGKPLPAARAIELMRQILDGLAHAHEHGVIHRDIKPENVFVTKDHTGAETLKLVDFGLAKIVSGEGSKDQMTKAGLVFGTPRYMSPEQAAGGKIDERTDLYACGIMLYEMLSGSPPFDSEDLVGLLRAQIAQDPPPLPASVPEALRAVVMRLLQKSSRDRHESARQLLDVLDQVAGALDRPGNPFDDLATGDTMGQIPLAALAAAGAPSLHGDTAGVSRDSLSFPAPGTVVAMEAPAVPVRSGATVPPRPWSSPRTWAFAAAGLAAAIVVFMIAAPEETETSTTDAPAAAAPVGQPSRTGAAGDESVNLASSLAKAIPHLSASADELAGLDAAIEGKRWAAADQQLQPLLDQYPRDPQLLWRRGKLQAQTKSKVALALASYAEAIGEDPSMLEDETFATELDALLWNPRLRDSALDLALQRMGEHGHEFILELAALDEHALGYVDRHRVLDAVAHLPQRDEFVEPKLQTALDAWQAGQAIDPCAAFDEALRAMKNAPDAYYLGTLEEVGAPRSRPASKAAKPAECKGAADELAAVRTLHLEKFGDAPRVYPADYASKNVRKKARAQSSGGDSGGRRQPVRSFFRRLGG
jgi:hypothetical protein